MLGAGALRDRLRSSTGRDRLAATRWTGETNIKAVLHHSMSSAVGGRICSQAPDWLRVVPVDPENHTQFRAEMRDAEMLLHVLTPVTSVVLAHSPRLRLIQKIGTGVDAIDRAAAAQRGVAVANMPGTNSQAVAEIALALMLSVLRRIDVLNQATRAGSGWRLSPEVFDRCGELSGRTVGFLGFGAIPRLLAPVVRAIGARLIFHSRSPQPAEKEEWRDMNDLLSQADVLSLHVPLTSDTRNIIDAKALARMREGAILINTSRGALVDEQALIQALESGRLSGAGLDVFGEEPVPAESGLLRLENVVLTPHVGWLTNETLARSLGVAFENCARLREGRDLLNRIQ